MLLLFMTKICDFPDPIYELPVTSKSTSYFVTVVADTVSINIIYPVRPFADGVNDNDEKVASKKDI